jgi:hypothetical protein
MEDDAEEDAEEDSSSWKPVRSEVENDSEALKLTANCFRSNVETDSEVVKLTMDHNQREVVAAVEVNAADVAVSNDALLPDRKAKTSVVHKDKVKSFHQDPPPSWLEPVRRPSASSSAATTEARADPTGLYDFVTQRRMPYLPEPLTVNQPPAADSDQLVDASAPPTDTTANLDNDDSADIFTAPSAGTPTYPEKKWKRKPVRLKDNSDRLCRSNPRDAN